MSIGRTILAVIVAFSVAMLPIARGTGESVKSTEMMEMSDDMSVAQDMPDCCPPAVTPCDKAMGNRASMAACASTCCGFLMPASSSLVFPLVLIETMPSLANQVFCPQTSSPPFRPPRV